ncbi:glycosyltransferase family 2 protein [Aegicerativicinus sediminis]|uniref:glycosyltransferase family 2 protein n=1 Tax=Aegicerativicinus sediminis TaxID=2893202 RepID=UPI001E44A5EA|nr:glycosyltransferase family 2 protein [Aegicerativicinus sediminis]
MKKIDISIIIPVFFNEGSIRSTYDVLKNEVFIKFPQLIFEIIFIDDGSGDNSFKEMCEVKSMDSSVQLIRFTRNFGQVSAFYAGYEKAKGEACLNIAADLQDPTDLIINIVNSYINREAQIIAGKRIDRDESFYRKKTSQMFYFFMQKLSFPKMPKGGFDVVLIDQVVKKFLLDSNDVNPFWQGQILWPGYSIKFIPYQRKKREIGSSKWSFSKKVKYLLDGILNYSYTPLRFISIIGILTFMLGILYAIIITIAYFFGNTPFQGWAPLMIIVLLFSGLQLLMLGVIGEYLWRALEQVKNRPKFIIKDELTKKETR